MVEKSEVEKFMAEKSGVENSEVEMSFIPLIINVDEIFENTFGGKIQKNI